MMDPMMMPPDDEGLDMMAMDSMMGGAGGDMEMVDVQVPAFAVAAVMELVSMLEEEMAGGGMGDMGAPAPMDAGMPPMDAGMGGGMPPMM
jgi:hypothetical protein